MLLLALALLAGGIYTAVAFVQRSETLVTERCTADVGTSQRELATDQTANASLITAVAVQRGLPARAASIALATAMQESKLRNIDHGDLAGPDSRGLFQQRPSQGWGTQEQIMDPYYAANAFYDALVKIPGYESLEITDAAQRVQRSAFPTAYAQHEVMGRSFASALSGQTPGAIQCTLRAPQEGGRAGNGGRSWPRLWSAAGPRSKGRRWLLKPAAAQAWSVAQWAVANAKDLAVPRWMSPAAAGSATTAPGGRSRTRPKARYA